MLRADNAAVSNRESGKQIVPAMPADVLADCEQQLVATRGTEFSFSDEAAPTSCLFLRCFLPVRPRLRFLHINYATCEQRMQSRQQWASAKRQGVLSDDCHSRRRYACACHHTSCVVTRVGERDVFEACHLFGGGARKKPSLSPLNVIPPT